MLTVFADESRTNEKVPIVAVGGGIGTGLQWSKLSKAWCAALDTEPEVDFFHSRDFETPEGRRGTIYEKWSKFRREQFNSYLTGAIRYYKIEKVTVFAVNPDEFESIKKSRTLRYDGWMNSYYCCAFMLIYRSSIWADKYFPNQKINFIFEQGGLHQKGIEILYNLIETDEKAKKDYKFWSKPTFVPKGTYRELEIADKLVYESAKHASHYFDEEPPERSSVISPQSGKPVWKTRYSPEQWILGGIDLDLRYLRKFEIEEFFNRHESG